MHAPFEGQSILVTGGTGSLGSALVARLLSGRNGRPRRVVVFSRDEAKQHEMRLRWARREAATDEVIYEDLERRLQFRVGDVRDPASLASALAGIDTVVHAAALKQVPTCEYFPEEAMRTNAGGAENLVRVIRDHRLPVQTVVGVSTDKAVKPVNVMGITKALQERILARGNLEAPHCRFVLVRYGNVLASRGSAVPLFLEQIARGGPVTITDPAMTRFFLSIEDAVDTVVAAAAEALPGETYVPRLPTARITDLTAVLIGDRPIATRITGIRPGEKLHEVLISEEERHRTVRRGGHYAIAPVLPELRELALEGPELGAEYSSADELADREQIAEILLRAGFPIGPRVGVALSAAS